MADQRNAWQNIGTLGSLGFTLVGSTFLGLAFGYFLDGRLGTAPWLMIVFLLVGITAGFVNIFNRGLPKKDRRQ